MARDEWIYGVEPVTEKQISKTIDDIKALHAKASQLRESVLAARVP
jgi:hypothetical protein